MARTQHDLVVTTRKLEEAEGRLGLSDSQLEELDQRIKDGLAEYLTSSLVRERTLEKRVADLELLVEAMQEKTDKDIKGCQGPSLDRRIAVGAVGASLCRRNRRHWNTQSSCKRGRSVRSLSSY